MKKLLLITFLAIPFSAWCQKDIFEWLDRYGTPLTPVTNTATHWGTAYFESNPVVRDNLGYIIGTAGMESAVRGRASFSLWVVEYMLDGYGRIMTDQRGNPVKIKKRVPVLYSGIGPSSWEWFEKQRYPLAYSISYQYEAPGWGQQGYSLVYRISF